MANITTTDIRAYIAKRQSDVVITRKARRRKLDDDTWVELPAETKAVSNAEINRELTILKRAFSLAIQAGKLYHKPHIPLLKEDNVRRGFFDDPQIDSVIQHLPEPLDDVIRFAFITGWRIPSEVLTLEWRQVDFAGGEVRLDPGTTKNSEGRVFPMTQELRSLLERRQRGVAELKRTRALLGDKSSLSTRPGLRRARARAYRAAFPTTCVAARFAILSARQSQSAWPCR